MPALSAGRSSTAKTSNAAPASLVASIALRAWGCGCCCDWRFGWPSSLDGLLGSLGRGELGDSELVTLSYGLQTTEMRGIQTGAVAGATGKVGCGTCR